MESVTQPVSRRGMVEDQTSSFKAQGPALKSATYVLLTVNQNSAEDLQSFIFENTFALHIGKVQ
jgi:hypothetical protein